MSDFQKEIGPAQFEAGVGFLGPQLLQSSADNLTAGTTHSQAGALQITSQFNRFTTVANASDACVLPPSFPGMNIVIVNASSSNIMQVYAAGSDTLNGIAGSTGVSQMQQSMCYFCCASKGTWTVQDLGVGTNGNYPTVQYQAALTAGTTQTAAGGTRITSSMAEFDTVASNGNSATLPAAQPGMQISVINNGANTLAVFALTAALGGVGGGDTINGSTSLNMASPPTITLFLCTVVGKWITK